MISYFQIKYISFILGSFWTNNHDEDRSIIETTIFYYCLGLSATLLSYMRIKPNQTISLNLFQNYIR